MRWDWDFLRARKTEFDNRFCRGRPPCKQVSINGHIREIDGAHLSDMEVAGRVRMLMRGQIDHEHVCELARDRIVYLADRLGEIESLTAEDIGRAILKVENDWLRPRLGVEPRRWDDLEESERESAARIRESRPGADPAAGGIVEMTVLRARTLLPVFRRDGGGSLRARSGPIVLKVSSSDFDPEGDNRIRSWVSRRLPLWPRSAKLPYPTMSVGQAVRRREFIARLGGAAVAWPFTARAQEVRHYRIAILAAPGWESFLDELGQAGFVDGHNLEVDGRGYGALPASYETVAVDLTKARLDVLMVAGPEAARAAQKATQRIPIVALVDDLVGSKLVASMSHPEGNTTGVAIFAFQLDVKRLELLHEALPGARRIAVFGDHEPIRNIEALESAARAFGIEIVPFSARSETEVIRAVDAMKATPVDAVNVLASPILGGALRLLIRDQLELHRLPAIWQWPEAAEAGGLIAYGPRLTVVFRQCARQVAKLLRGAKVADVPVEQPTNFELVINAKTAKALNIAIPLSMLSRADQVIE